MSKVTKDEIVKTLTGKLSEIADAVIKEVNEKAPSNPPATPPVEKTATPPAENAPTGNEVLTKSVADLATKVEELSKKLNAPTPPAEKTAEEKTADITKKQGEIKAGMLELVKSMGIDTENVDVDFTVKEKKKGTIVAKSEKFDKSEDDDDPDNSEELLNKELSELEPEQKKEALDHYFKSLIFPHKS